MKRLLFPLLLLAACAPPRPTLTYLPDTPIGEGGKIARDLYRSGWSFPTNDTSPVRIGIVPARKELRFRALRPMKIRAYSESGSWEVASPDGVTWNVAAAGLDRPPHTTYFASVDSLVLPVDRSPEKTEVSRWIRLGFSSARWIGPPNDLGTKEPLQHRWFLSVTPPTGEKTAQEICGGVQQRTGKSCQVIARVELPPMARGILRAENGTFSKPFSGLLELVSPRSPVALLDVVLDHRTGEKSIETYGPRLFVVPELSGTLSMIQSTSLGDYLEGVVPAEIYPTAPIEALKAQAIVARTFSLRTVPTANTDRPYSICASTDCQVYRGEGLKKSETSEAVAESAGMVVKTPEGDFAETFYHAICGGHTEPKHLIWGPPEPAYLRGVSDQPEAWTPLPSDTAVRNWLAAPTSSYCGKIAARMRPDRWRWEATLNSSAIRDLFVHHGLTATPSDIRVTKRGHSGRALEIELVSLHGSRKIRGELEIRKELGGLLSSLFVFAHDREGDRLLRTTVHGGAYGHGVGLCQMGAMGRAEAGESVREILGAYYPGTHIGTIDETPKTIVLK